MRQSAKRTHSGSKTCPNGLPAVDDHNLVQRVSILPLEPEAHRRVVLLGQGLVPGKFGLLKRSDRDWLLQLAVAGKVMPQKFKPKSNVQPYVAADAYSARDSDGSRFAADHLAKYAKIPTPPKLPRNG